MTTAAPPVLLDEDVSRWALLHALRTRGFDVTSIVELSNESLDDDAVLELAVHTGRVLVTFNVGDFCRLHQEYLSSGSSHSGIIVVPRQQEPVGVLLKKLISVLLATPADQWTNRLVFI
ncbi:MAG TPA: DUF5615 family PIN-like protein [Planctomycetaceae bacterium]|nr:DUF5615 family PIN-like protein [Planctomycetaceae bacterium]